MDNLRHLPNPAVLQTPDFETIVKDNIALLKTLKPDYAWLESDDYMLLIEAFAYRELHLRQEFNNRLQASFLLLAKGSNLDARAVDYGIWRLEGEADSALLLRILDSLNRFSTAGSKESYEYHAKSVSAAIDDVTAISLQAGKVAVFVASFAGRLAEHIIPAVSAALADVKVRPLTDAVTVMEASNKAIDITIEVELLNLKQAAVSEAAIRKNFLLRQFTIHEPLTAFEMVTSCNVAGVHNAIVITPASGVVADVGERLVIRDLAFAFKQAVIEV